MIRTMEEAERLLEHVLQYLHPALSPSQHAEMLERLCWASADPDGLLLAVRDKWLRGDDRYRVEVALGFEETFPIPERLEMEAVLGQVVQRWPELKPRCEALMTSRVAHESSQRG